MDDFSQQFMAYWQALRRRWRTAAAFVVLVTGATAVASFSMRPVYRAAALVLIEKENGNTLTREEVSVDSRDADYYQTQYEIIKSRRLAERVVEDLNLKSNPEFNEGGDPAAALQKKIEVVPVRRSRLVELAAESLDRGLSARIANTLAQKYVEQNLENRLYLSKEVLKALNDDASTASFESLPAVVNSSLVQELKIQKAKLEGGWADFSGRYTPRHPQMIQLKAQLEATREQIDREIRHIADSVKIQLSGQLQGNNVRIIDEALVPRFPVRPKKTRNVLFALLAGIMAGWRLAYFLDRLDLVFSRIEDVESLLKIPALGALPKITGFSGDHPASFTSIWDSTRSHAAEGFRNLRTSISFRLSTVKGTSVIQVTSSVPGEGKSLIAANLARAFAQAGEKVLLVDGDLRRPSVQRIFDMEAGEGLSSYLAAGRRPEDLVRETGIPNLWVLPCGPLPDNPSELLSAKKIKSLFDWATAQYDRVIVDSPPVFPISDALLWAPHVHGVAFVVLAGRVRAAIAERARQKLGESFANILGGILNLSPLESAGYYYNYHAYYVQNDGRKQKERVLSAKT